jgi:phosphoglycerate dehydrogenase-like enzyme
MRIALLDDYQSVALSSADWKSLPSDCEVVAFADHVRDVDQLVLRLSPFDAICPMRERTIFTRAILERLPRLKLILATGGRNTATVDLAAARELGITVCETRSYPPPTVELTWWLLLSLFRRGTLEHASVRHGGWQLGIGDSLWEKTLGIVGLGKLGGPVAQVARAFGMRVIAWSTNLTAERAQAQGVIAVSKEELFSTADAITIHMPLSDRSCGLIGAADLARMKTTAFLVNTSRAPLVDQQALLDAVRMQRIAGLGVDVFEEEPLPAAHPYRHLPNVVATPHIGYVTRESYAVYLGDCVANASAYLQGKPTRVIN